MRHLLLLALATVLAAADGAVDWNRDVIAASAKTPVLVDFHAAWCPPCRKLGPLLEEAAKARAGKLVLVKIDTDQQPAIAQDQKVSGIPDVRLFIGGKQVDAFVGYRDANDLAAWLDAALKPR
jgi:putative thioredoxin